jgi:hypothetical protein
MGVIAIVIAAVLLGWMLLVPFEKELHLNVVGLLGMSYIVGIGMGTFVQYLFTLMGGKLTLASISLLSIASIVAAYKLSGKRRVFKPSVPLQIRDWILLALCTPLFAGNSYVAWLTPIYWPDSIFSNDGIGRIIAIDGRINMPFLAGNLYFYGLNSLSMQLLHAGTYILSTDRVGVLYSGFYVAFVLMFHSFIFGSDHNVSGGKWKQLVRSLPGLIVTVSVASTPFVFAMGYVVLNGLPAAVYLFGGILAWKRFLESPSARLALLTGMMFALCSWTRYDGFLFYCLVELLTIFLAMRSEVIRRYLLMLVSVPAMMTCLRYIIVFVSGQADRFAAGAPIAFFDLSVDLVVAALGASIYWAGALLLRCLRFAAQAFIALGVVGFGWAIVRSSTEFLHSVARLRMLVTDPVWGGTLLFAIIAVFSWSLFRGVPRLLLVVLVAFVALRVALYARLSGTFAPLDESITHSGNRILLYVWPLFLFWVSCSEEVSRLCSFGSRRSPRRPEIFRGRSVEAVLKD